MEKIPVGTTIARAYGFAFGQFFTLLGIVWLPWAILAAGGLVLMPQSLLLSGAMAGGTISNAGPALLMLIPFYVVTILLLLMQIVGLTQQALGTRKGSPFFYFDVGRPLRLLVGTMLLFVLASVGLIVAAVMSAVLVVFLGNLVGAGGRIAAILIDFVGAVAVYLGFIYVLVRMSFLMTPVVVAENRIGIKRAWSLGKGNFWRMFLILLAVLVPIMAVLFTLLFGFMLRGMPLPPSGSASPDQLAQYRAAASAWSSANAGQMTRYWYLTYPFYIVFSVIFYGLVAGAQASAYRALVPEENLAETFS